MTTKLVELPVVAGGSGAAEFTGGLETRKTVLVQDVIGGIQVQSSSDGVEFCTVASFVEGPARDQIIEVEGSFMRVLATGGDAAAVYVSAESGQVRSGVIPPPPQGGPGASLDIASFGPHTTVYCNGLLPGDAVGFEISLDGSAWSADFRTFTKDGCVTKDVAARFIRAVGKSRLVSVPVLNISSQEPLGESANSCVTIGPADSPFQASDGETVFVNTFGQEVTIIAPPATGNPCDTFTVKDAGGTASLGPITVVPSSPAGVIEDPVLDQNCQSRSWESDGEKWIPVTDYGLRSIDQATLITDGNLVQVATYDDELQSILFQINEVMDLILTSVGGD